MTREARERTEDCGAHYEAVRRSLVELVRSLDDRARATRIPPCPAWSVVDVVGHVAGIASDLNHLRFPEGSPEEWTDAQVDRIRTRGFEAVVAEWDAEAPKFEQGLRDFGYSMGCHFLGDLFIHTTDVRAATGASVDRASTTMWIALDWYLEALDARLRELDLSLRVVAGPESTVAGVGDPTATVTGDPFELLRALAGRRTAAEIAAFGWDGDAPTFLDEFSRYPLPEQPVGT